jgi:alpha-ketoglutarate-dependent taurine dioxygenase
MTGERRPEWTLEPLEPFGLVALSVRGGADVGEISAHLFKEWVARHCVVVARGFARLEGKALPEFGQRFGEVLEWDFGQINELRVRTGARNYLYTNRAVPFHWDGAFVGRIPRYIIFQCEAAPPPGAGGETLFCDTRRVLERAAPHERAAWGRTVITYSTERIVHYGGTFTSPLLARHPSRGEFVLRYAEPVEDLNPVQLEIEGVGAEARAVFLPDMHRRLRDPSVCYVHQWRDGDILIADNYVLLHGRRAFAESAPRHIRRVNVL